MQHGLCDGACFGRIVGRRLVGDHLDLRMVGEGVVIGVELVEIGRSRRLTFEDRDLARLARALPQWSRSWASMSPTFTQSAPT